MYAGKWKAARVFRDKVVLEARLRMLQWTSRRRRQPLTIHFVLVRKGIGMFAELNSVLYCVRYAKSLGALAVVSLNSDTYRHSDDEPSGWLGQYFDTTWMHHAMPSSPVLRCCLTAPQQLPFYGDRVGHMSIWDAHKISEAHLQPLPDIAVTVDSFVESTLGRNFIGIHWRGTDKKSEAPPITVEQVVAMVSRVAHSLDTMPRAVYLATDEHQLFVQLETALQDAFPNLVLVSRENVERSKDGAALHRRDNLSPAQRRKMGEDALIDCLILSKSRALIRTASFLSGWCSVFNPTLPVYMLNSPYERCLWFPDREVKMISDYFEKRLSTRA